MQKTCQFIKPAIIIFAIIFILFLSSCTPYEDKVLNSLGEYKNHLYFSEGFFQDFTDYAKYYYDSANLKDNKYFTKIKEADLNTINEHLDDFEGWIETIKSSNDSSELVLNYDFDRTIIDITDYVYIDSEKQTWDDGVTTLVNYDVYFFDSQTMVLYYFHNNI